MTRNLTVEAARSRMLLGVTPGPPEMIALDRFAAGRVLAEPIAAIRDQPPFDASAMDGWAVRAGALDDGAERRFRVVGESAAGRAFEGEVRSGEAIRVFTGAPVPPGCAVIVQEKAERQGDHVVFQISSPRSPSHVRPRAGDFAAGEILLPAGVRLDALRLSVAASAGRAKAAVAPRPRLAILSTGEEIVRPGRGEIHPYQIFESSSPALSTLTAGWGGAPMILEPAGDEEDAIVAAVQGVDAELIVTVGGASVGDYDLVKPALGRLGLEIAVETVNLRPGKPTWFGRLSDGRRVLGLPGNPASALVSAELFLRPLLLAWQGGDPALPMETAQLGSGLPPTGPREHWMRAKLSCSADGRQIVTPFSDQDSSRVSIFAQSNALLRRPAGGESAGVGATADVLRLDRL